MAIRRVLADAALADALDVADLELHALTDPLDIGTRSPGEVLVVSADPEVLAAAGRLGVHRLVPTGAEATAAAVEELVREVQRS